MGTKLNVFHLHFDQWHIRTILRLQPWQTKAERFYALQFHPEVVHTPMGFKIIKNFVFHICGLQAAWTMKSFIETATEEIRAKSGKEKGCMRHKRRRGFNSGRGFRAQGHREDSSPVFLLITEF